MHPQATLPCVLALALLTTPGAADPGGFRAGDLLYVSPTLPGVDAGVLRIDPVSGETELLIDLGSVFQFGSFACYDPWRDRLILRAIQNGVQDFYTVDADGNLGVLAASYPNAVRPAPTGDGRIYLSLPSNSPGLSWLDANDAEHVLMNEAGTAPFVLQPGFAIGGTAMVYDPRTNSLLLGSGGNSNPCPGGVNASVHLFKVPLSADGTRAGGPVICSQFDIMPGFGESPLGLGRGPGDDFLLIARTANSSAALNRFLLIDPVTLSLTPWASSSGSGTNTLGAGTWSHLLGRALVADTANDVLRAYGPGSAGGGVVLSTSLPISQSTSAGEFAELIEVGPVAQNWGLLPDVSALSLAAGGTQTLQHDYGAAHAGDVHVVLGSTTGWNPGFAIEGIPLPIFFDTYTLFTAQFPNAAPLGNSLGVLDAQGRATTTFTLPAGFSPSLAGATLFHAALVWSPITFASVRASNPVPIGLLP